MKNYYKILGLTPNANNDEIKKAYRNLSVKYHPDSNLGNKNTEEIMKEINEAYHILKDANRRKDYDFYFTKYYKPEEIIVYKENKTEDIPKENYSSSKSKKKAPLLYIVISLFMIGIILIILLKSNNKNQTITPVNQLNTIETPQQIVNNDELITYEILDICQTYDKPRIKKIYKIKSENKYGLADADSNIIVNPEYEYIDCEYSSDDLFVVKKNNHLGLIDIKGNIVISINYCFVGNINTNGYARVCGVDYKYGIVDFNEKEIIPIENDDCSGFFENLVFIKKGGKASLINGDLKYVTGFIFDDFGYDGFKNSYASVKKGNKWGFIDKKGNVVIPFMYDFTYGPIIDNGEFKFNVSYNGKWRWVNIQNQRTSSPSN
jgi:curved DNA-binding protein CbpA